jgi:peroxiredoxin
MGCAGRSRTRLSSLLGAPPSCHSAAPESVINSLAAIEQPHWKVAGLSWPWEFRLPGEVGIAGTHSMTIVAPETPLLRPPAARSLDAGDAAPIVHGPDHAGTPASTGTGHLAGKPILLLFSPSLDEEILVAFRDAFADLTSHQATLFAISRQGSEANGAVHARLALPFAILADTRADIFKGYGVDPYPAEPGATLFMLDASHRVARVLERMAPAAMVKETLAELGRLSAAPSHAPAGASAGAGSAAHVERRRLRFPGGDLAPQSAGISDRRLHQRRHPARGRRFQGRA